MRVFVKFKQQGNAGNLSTFAIKVKPEFQIYEIKGYISNRLGLEPWEQKLSIKQHKLFPSKSDLNRWREEGEKNIGEIEEEAVEERVLHNDQTLEHYNIREDDSINLERIGEKNISIPTPELVYIYIYI